MADFSEPFYEPVREDIHSSLSPLVLGWSLQQLCPICQQWVPSSKLMWLSAIYLLVIDWELGGDDDWNQGVAGREKQLLCHMEVKRNQHCRECSWALQMLLSHFLFFMNTDGLSLQTSFVYKMLKRDLVIKVTQWQDLLCVHLLPQATLQKTRHWIRIILFS